MYREKVQLLHRVCGIPLSICNVRIDHWSNCSSSGATAGLSLIFTQMVTWLHNSGKGFKDSNCGVSYYLAGVLSSLLKFLAFLVIGKKMLQI